MLSSLNTVIKETAVVSVIFGRASPDPGFGSQVELSRRHASGLLDLLGIGETLTGEGIAAEEAPPTFLQIEPTGSRRNEDVLEAGMAFQPGARFEAIMTAEIVADDVEVAFGIVGFDVGQKRDVALGIA